jgi:O-antigen/teichoic acid export membrane protein
VCTIGKVKKRNSKENCEEGMAEEEEKKKKKKEKKKRKNSFFLSFFFLFFFSFFFSVPLPIRIFGLKGLKESKIPKPKKKKRLWGFGSPFFSSNPVEILKKEWL